MTGMHIKDRWAEGGAAAVAGGGPTKLCVAAAKPKPISLKAKRDVGKLMRFIEKKERQVCCQMAGRVQLVNPVVKADSDRFKKFVNKGKKSASK
jgi:hypothetical protein